jgi:hypothetical protein
MPVRFVDIGGNVFYDCLGFQLGVFFPIFICFLIFVIVRNRVSKIREHVFSVWKDHTFISACC